MMGAALHRRLKGKGVVVSAVHPGMVGTRHLLHHACLVVNHFHIDHLKYIAALAQSFL